MKAKLAKALVLALALTLALTGCKLVEVDPVMKADRDIAKIDEDYSVMIASYNGGEVTASEIVGNYFNNVSVYDYLGMTLDDATINSIVDSLASSRVEGEIAIAKYHEAGNSLTEEQLAQTAETAQSNYDSNYQSALDAAAGDTQEQKEQNARVILRANGMDYDTQYNMQLFMDEYAAMEEWLKGEVTELTDEELQTALDEKVTEQQTTFADGSSFENAMSGDDTTIYWTPDGYRTVKHILLMPSDANKTAYTDAVSAQSSAQSTVDSLNTELAAANDEIAEDGERSAEEIQTELDAAQATLDECKATTDAAAQACLDEVKATSDEIYTRLEAGESFEDLIAEFGQDPGMQNEPTKTRGYYVSAASTAWETNFRDAAMALENVGDYTTTPVVSGSGVHIIQYVSDVTGGAAKLEDVRDKLYDEALTAAQDKHVEDTLAAWVEEAQPQYFLASFTQAINGN